MKNKILNSLKYEVNKGIRRYIGEISIELARQFMESEASNSWPEFWDYVFLNVNHTLQFKESTLQFLASFPGIFCNVQSRYLDGSIHILEACMADWTKHRLQFEAVKTFTSFVLQYRNDVNVQHPFQVDCFNFFLLSHLIFPFS